MDVKGKVAIVTGAARGLGKLYAEELLKKGAKVRKSRQYLEIEFRLSASVTWIYVTYMQKAGSMLFLSFQAQNALTPRDYMSIYTGLYVNLHR